MTSFNTREFKHGIKLLIDGIPMLVLENEFVKPGKGQAFNRVKLKNLINNKCIEKTFKSGDVVKAANIKEIVASYCYFDSQYYVFMDETFNQYNVLLLHLGETKKWIKTQDKCNLLIFNNEVIKVNPQNFVNLKVKATEIGLKGDTVSSAWKKATLETGAEIKIPLFVKVNEIIKIDTRTGEYVERSKD